MSGMDLTAARGLITSGAAVNGLTLSAEATETAAKALAASTKWDAGSSSYQPVDGETRAFRVVDGRAVDIELVEHVIGIVRQHANARPAPDTSTGPWTGRTAAALNAPAAREAAKVAQARDIAAQANPWQPGKINRTHQAIIAKYLPDMAAKMQATAGR